MYTNTLTSSNNMANIENLDANILLKIIVIMQEEHIQEIKQMTQQSEYENKKITTECGKCITEYSMLKYKNQTLTDRTDSYIKVNKELSSRLKCIKEKKKNFVEKWNV